MLTLRRLVALLSLMLSCTPAPPAPAEPHPPPPIAQRHLPANEPAEADEVGPLRRLVVSRAYLRMVDCGHDDEVGGLACAFAAKGDERALEPGAALHLFLTDPPGLVLATTPWHPSEALAGRDVVVAECEFEERGRLASPHLAATKGVPGWLYLGDIDVGVASDCKIDPFAGLPADMAAAHVLVMHDESKGKPAKLERTRAEAIERAKRVGVSSRKGTPFAALAAELSDEPGAAERGGSLGHFGEGMMIPMFEMMVRATPIGERSAPFETDFGFHVVERRRP